MGVSYETQQKADNWLRYIVLRTVFLHLTFIVSIEIESQSKHKMWLALVKRLLGEL